MRLRWLLLRIVPAAKACICCVLLMTGIVESTSAQTVINNNPYQRPPGTFTPLYPTTPYPVQGYQGVNAGYYRVAQVPGQIPAQPRFGQPIVQPQIQNVPGAVAQPNFVQPGMQNPGYVAPGVNGQPGYFQQPYCPPGQNVPPCDNMFYPRGTIQANALLMRRSSVNNFPLLLDAANATKFDARSLGFSYDWGIDAAVSYRTSPSSNVEIRYFQIDGWTSRGSSPFVAGDFIASMPPQVLASAGTVDYIYSSELHNFEINIVGRVSDRFRLGAGFRWVEVDELLNQTFSPMGMAAFAWNIDTYNHLYGFQLSADYYLVTVGRFSAGTYAKGGIFANVADSATTIIGPGGTTTSFLRNTKPAFVGETGIAGEFQLFPRISLIGGYQLMWISGIALAPDQLPNTNAMGIPITLDHSDMFYHGAYFGVELRW
jgi:hypothetical protein